MYNLLSFFSIPLGNIGWIDISTLLSTIALIVYIYRFGRSRVTKTDMNEALDKKASKNMVVSELRLRDERICHVEKLSEIQDKYLKDTLEEQHAILDTVQSDIKELLKRVK